MLETKCVDDNFEILVTVLAVFVAKILYPLSWASGVTDIKILSLTSTCHQHLCSRQSDFIGVFLVHFEAFRGQNRKWNELSHFWCAWRYLSTIISHYSRLFKFIRLLLKYFVDASTTLKIEVVPSAKNGNLGIHFINFFEHGRRSNLTVACFFLTLVTKIKVKI